jgi:hypothetical protein
VAKVGLEPTDASAIPTNDLRQATPQGAAQSGAVGAEPASTSNLEALAAALLALPPADRAAVLARIGRAGL